jgi:hypothetical protein
MSNFRVFNDCGGSLADGGWPGGEDETALATLKEAQQVAKDLSRHHLDDWVVCECYSDGRMSERFRVRCAYNSDDDTTEFDLEIDRFLRNEHAK